jgi:hypothetical protein
MCHKNNFIITLHVFYSILAIIGGSNSLGGWDVFSGKHKASVVAGAQQRRLGRELLGPEVQASPVASIRGQTSPGNLHRRADNETGTPALAGPENSVSSEDATGLQGYARWARFTVGPPGGEAGAFFEDKASTAKYTWTPAQRG